MSIAGRFLQSTSLLGGRSSDGLLPWYGRSCPKASCRERRIQSRHENLSILRRSDSGGCNQVQALRIEFGDTSGGCVAQSGRAPSHACAVATSGTCAAAGDADGKMSNMQNGCARQHPAMPVLSNGSQARVFQVGLPAGDIWARCSLVPGVWDCDSHFRLQGLEA